MVMHCFELLCQRFVFVLVFVFVLACVFVFVCFVFYGDFMVMHCFKLRGGVTDRAKDL